MTLISLSEVLKDAERGNYAVGAFNVSDLNQATAVLEAAHEESSPVIIQVIAGMHPYTIEKRWWHQLRLLIESYEHLAVTLHLDHGRSFADCARAVDSGFTGVMIDASRDLHTNDPSEFEDNVRLTRDVVEYAHAAGVSVEGELGTVGGAEAGLTGVEDEIIFTDPLQAADFVAQTQVDALAVAVGTSHGAVKFTNATQSQRLQLDLIDQIKQHIPNTYLVLHGSSSIPSELIETINKYGGKLPNSFGIGTSQKQASIQSGIRKINQGTDSHLAWTAALRKFLHHNPKLIEPSAATKSALVGMQFMVQQRMREFGSSGRLSAVKP